MYGISTEKSVDEVLEAAINKWGYDTQIDMAMGECGEFIAEVVRWRTQGRGTVQSVCEEVADVIIMMLQLRKMIGPSVVDASVASKLARLQDKLDE